MDNTTSPIVSVIIVTWNNAGHIVDCLQSVETACTNIPSEVIVVDNNSSDATCHLVQSCLPSVHLFSEHYNWGYGKGNNIGIQQAKGDFILILNPDTKLTSQALATMLNTIQKNPRIGFLGPKILNANGSFQAACRRNIPTPTSALCKMIGLSKIWPNHPLISHYNMGHLPEDQAGPVEAISGSCMLIRKAAIGEGFDPRFFMYAEDLDLCLTITQKGWIGYYEPSAIMTHLHRGSSSKRWVKSTLHFYYSAYLFFRKHYRHSSSRWTQIIIALGLILATFASLVKQWIKRIGARIQS